MFREKKVARDFKQCISADDSRRNRVTNNLTLRSEIRTDQLQRRRKQALGDDLDDVEVVPESEKPTAENIYMNVTGLSSPDPEVVLRAARFFRRILSVEKSPPINQCIAIGAPAALVKHLHHPDNAIVFEAAWALTNVASGTTEQTAHVVELGVIPIFCSLLNSSSPDVYEQSVWALGNIAGDSHIFRDVAIKAGALHGIVQLAKMAFQQPQTKQITGLLSNCSWAISNFARGKPQPAFSDLAPALEVLIKFFQLGVECQVVDTVWCVSYLTDLPQGMEIEEQEAIHRHLIDSGIVGYILSLLSTTKALRTATLRAIGNLLTGPDSTIGYLLERGLLDQLMPFLDLNIPALRKETCWAISNVAASRESQHIQLLLTHEVLHRLANVIHDEDSAVRKEATWAVVNLFLSKEVTFDVIHFFLQSNVLRVFASMLQNHDIALQLEILRLLGNLFASEPATVEQFDNLGGVQVVENLQKSSNLSVYEHAKELLVRYFQATPANDYDITAGVDDINNNQFNF